MCGLAAPFAIRSRAARPGPPRRPPSTLRERPHLRRLRRSDSLGSTRFQSGIAGISPEANPMVTNRPPAAARAAAAAPQQPYRPGPRPRRAAAGDFLDSGRAGLPRRGPMTASAPPAACGTPACALLRQRRDRARAEQPRRVASSPNRSAAAPSTTTRSAARARAERSEW